jgi:hypothetical protein
MTRTTLPATLCFLAVGSLLVSGTGCSGDVQGTAGAAGGNGGAATGDGGGGGATPGTGGAGLGAGGAASGGGAGGTTSSGAGGTTSSGAGAGGGGGTGAGGRGGGGGAGGAAGHGGVPGAGGGAGGAGGATGPNTVFSQCRFHFGTLDSVAKANPSIIAQIDFFTPGWLGSSDTFNMGGVCTETNPGGVLANKVPVIVAYAAAFYVKRHFALADCNASTGTQDLCHLGAQNIQANLPAILNVYRSYAQGLASCYGTKRPIIFEMEPDWYQYVGSSQTQPMTEAQAGTIMGQFVAALKQSLPNAVFSLDVSPWVGSNGKDNGAEWFSHFDMTQFTYVNTSGGGTDATAARIRSANQMTWAGVTAAAGKPILADTGYGVNGRPAGPDVNWDTVANINARIGDGVVSISQYNPTPATWGATIAGDRPQLSGPAFCP